MRHRDISFKVGMRFSTLRAKRRHDVRGLGIAAAVFSGVSGLVVSMTRHRRLVHERDTALATVGALREGLLFVTDGRVVDVNEPFCDMAGVDRALLVGRRPL